MDYQKHAQYWFSSAQSDLEVAQALFQIQKYDWCLFIAHLVLEKMLKGLFVQARHDYAPRSHKLDYLAESGGISLTPEQKVLLLKVNEFNVETRYSDYQKNFKDICTEKFAFEYFTKIQEVYQWLLTMVKH